MTVLNDPHKSLVSVTVQNNAINNAPHETEILIKVLFWALRSTTKIRGKTKTVEHFK